MSVYVLTNSFFFIHTLHTYVLPPLAVEALHYQLQGLRRALFPRPTSAYVYVCVRMHMYIHYAW